MHNRIVRDILSNGKIVSTISIDRSRYETLVLLPGPEYCIIDIVRYSTELAAYDGHRAMMQKWEGK